MSETVLTIEEAARCLSDLVERVHANGEAAVLVKSGRPLVRIVPFRSQAPVVQDLIAFLRQWRIEHPEPDEQLAEVIQEGRRVVQPPRDPWE
jgi:antitoxin (DNA-binding transcriptional repressor) of toxin-antitoxin stability system